MEKNKVSSHRIREGLSNAAPVMGLVLVTAVFAVLTKGRTVSAMNLKILMNQIILTALVATGAVFSFSCGAFDMSVGGSLCLSAIAGALAGLKTGSAGIMIITVFAVSMGIALFKGVAAAYLTLPVFIVTVIFSGVLSAIGLVLLNGVSTLSVGEIVGPVNMTVINILFLGGFFLVSLIIFNYTRIGKACKLQGGNPLASAQSGISGKACIIIAFLMSGIGITLAAVITLLRTKTVTASTGASIGTDMMVAIVLGGMPLSGGPRSRISAAVVGAAIITILNNGLSVYGVPNDVIQVVRGVIFLGVVFLTSMNYRTRLLPR